MLHIQINDHGFPLISAGPDVIDELGTSVEVMDISKISLVEVEIDLYLINLLRLNLKIVNLW